jgi:transposase
MAGVRLPDKAQKGKARGRIRTNDRRITNAVLYRLSYAGSFRYDSLR